MRQRRNPMENSLLETFSFKIFVLIAIAIVAWLGVKLMMDAIKDEDEWRDDDDEPRS
jgi:hypothetical protein